MDSSKDSWDVLIVVMVIVLIGFGIRGCNQSKEPSRLPDSAYSPIYKRGLSEDDFRVIEKNAWKQSEHWERNAVEREILRQNGK